MEWNETFETHYDGAINIDHGKAIIYDLFNCWLDEVVDFQWIQIPQLKQEMKENPSKFTSWFKSDFEIIYHD